jgi:3-dehydroquinate dehydratase type I
VIPQICVSILPKNIDDTLELIAEAETAGANLVEVRMDCLEETHSLQDLPKSTRLPLIATNKLKSESGFFAGSEADRQQTLINAVKSGFEYVDVDFCSQNPAEAIALFKVLGAKTMVSYHKTDGPMPHYAMEKVLKNQLDCGADVCKIVTTAKKIEDNPPILNFISENASKTKLVCFCMGEAGKTSRLLSPVFGSFFTFAALNEGGQTAPGQMNIKEMHTAYRMLGIL